MLKRLIGNACSCISKSGNATKSGNAEKSGRVEG